MAEHRMEAEASPFNLHNIFFILFKWKRTIGLLTLVGLLLAAGVFLFYPATYESDATLLVRYVVDRSAVDPLDPTGATAAGAFKTNDTVIHSEVAILQSWDLAMQVAESLGPKRVLPDAKSPSVGGAASAIAAGLNVVSAKGSNVLLVSYTNSNPQVTSVVLNELINRYFTKHLEVHRSAGAFDFVTQQTDQVRARLSQTEDALKALKAKTGVLDLKESTGGLLGEESRISDTLRAAEDDLAEERARLKLMEGGMGFIAAKEEQSPPQSQDNGSQASGTAQTQLAQNSPAPTPSSSASQPAQPRPAEVDQYQSLLKQVSDLRQEQIKLLTKYTSNSTQVKLNQSQTDDLEKQKREMEKKFPSLSNMGGSQDIASERAKLAGLEAKTAELRRQLANTRERMKQLGDAGPQIVNLERTRDLQENNYKYFENSLEKARIDEALDPAKMPNISAVQRASPPGRVTKTRNQIAGGLAAGGLVLGIGFALLNELLLKKAVNRALELENQLHMPVLLSIPDARRNGRLRLKRAKSDTNGSGQPEVPPWETGHFIRSYAAAIRDRLSLHFELHGVTHKPKLVGVTALNDGAGSSTLAAGLAAALSETGDGKVLLVDVNVADGEVHPFFAGRPALPLSSALQSSAPADSPTENLYVATIAPANAHPTRVGLKRFFALMPNLKASDFDYVIFDLPPVNQTSPAVGLAGFMDKVLLVVEAEKNSRDSVKRGYRELTDVRADVAVVLNKVHSYAPKWLTQES
jgi:polysaccharide biosynthesis transport protein